MDTAKFIVHSGIPNAAILKHEGRQNVQEATIMII
jgi:hypothetical protein